jgi:multiple antibiotic resistance protein
LFRDAARFRHNRACDSVRRGRPGRFRADPPRGYRGPAAPARRDVADRASLIAGAILIGTALLGDLMRRALGISLSAFRIAGSLLLFAIAFEMVLGARMRREGQGAEEAVEEHVRAVLAG